MERIEIKIRKAIGSEQFLEAERLLDGYVSELQRRLLVRRSIEDIQRADRFMSEMSQLARIARAHVSARLEPLRKTSRYAEPANAPTTWTIDA
jgi:hypothetical protein